MNKADAKESLRTAWKLCTNGADWPFVAEHMAVPGRLYRNDWSCLELKLSIEIDGVVYDRTKPGRHQTAAGVTDGCVKGNALIAEGWRVLHYTPKMINDDPYGVIQQIIAVATMLRKHAVAD